MRRSQLFTQTFPYVIMLYEKKLRFYSNSSICHYVVWEEVKVLLKFFHMSLYYMRRSQSCTQAFQYSIILYEKMSRFYSNSSIWHNIIWKEGKVLLKHFHVWLCCMRRRQGFTQTLPYLFMLYQKKSRFYSNTSICHYVVWEEVKVLRKHFHISLCCIRRSQDFTQTLPYVIMFYEKKSRFYANTSICHYVVWGEVKV